MARCPRAVGGGWGGQVGYSIPPVTFFQVGQNETSPVELRLWATQCSSIPTVPPPAMGCALPAHPHSKHSMEELQGRRWSPRGLSGVMRELSSTGEWGEDFRLGLPPPPSVHHAYLSLLAPNWRITPQPRQASHPTEVNQK